MNRVIYCIIVTLIILLAGCSSQTVKYGAPPEAKVNREILDKKRSVNLVPEKHIWIIREGLKGEAGLFKGDVVQNINKLDMSVFIQEFLASVDISISYSGLNNGDNYEFKYPAFHGMLVRDFQVKVGARSFRAIISAKESAEEIYKIAKKRGFNATLVSQKVFGDMIVKTSLREKSDMKILFSYTQLTSHKGQNRILAIPGFSGMEKAAFNLKISASFMSPLVSFTGLNRNVIGKKFSLTLSDKKILSNGLHLSYMTEELSPLSSDGKVGIKWDSKSENYKTVEVGNRYLPCHEVVLEPAFAFLRFKELIQQKRPVKEIQDYSIQAKLLTPVTRLLLVDSTR